MNRFRDLIGYVPQDDILHPHLTAREIILFSARTRLGRILNDEEIHRAVDHLISALGLSGVKDSLIGDQDLRGVSGGERKRISIGLELVAAPRLLILDEPTWGLDAQAALSVIGLLKALSRNWITIICVLHQPRLEIFNALDSLLLLRNGNQVFLGSRAESEQFSKEMGYYFDPQLNPADIILDIISTHQHTPSFIQTENISKEKTVSGTLENTPDISKEDENLNFENLLNLHHLQHKRKAPWHRQLYLCCQRDMKQQGRNMGKFVLEVTAGILTGLLMGLALYEYDESICESSNQNQKTRSDNLTPLTTPISNPLRESLLKS